MAALITNAGGFSQELLTPASFPIVGIGASAGGLEALIAFLRSLSADTGMAFVVVQHLAPGHESMLAQLLSRETTMPVQQAEHRALLSPNHVYVIPPKVEMTVSGYTLMLRPREAAGSSIDPFLRSLAECHGSNAVAVILSGSGSDGASGAQAISEAGGVVFAQEPASAKFNSMPRSAIATGCVDFILPAGEISLELVRLGSQPKLCVAEKPEDAAPLAGREDDFQTVLDILSSTTGIDFRFYRQATVRRRVIRRLAALNQASLAEYIRHLRSNPDEVHALTQDLLIRVTHFFRDPSVFEALKRKVFPALIRRTPADGPVRIWVPGCSTGEEAYSLAMCFQEVAETMQSRASALVFATDINEAAVERARRGVYLDHIVADVAPSRLERFFVRKGREFRIGKSLRDMCIFSRHDLLRNPPFSRMGLVSCRNVLIYLDSMREQALTRFHFALDTGGYLLLGKSETAASSHELFTPVETAAKIYVKQAFAARPETPSSRARNRAIETSQARSNPTTDAARLAELIVIERYGPRRVIVDSGLEAMSFDKEPTAMRMPAFVNQNLKLLSEAKKIEGEALKKAVAKARKTGHSIRIERAALPDASACEIDIEVTPLGSDRQCFLVVFEERIECGELLDANLSEAERRGSQARISRLERELAAGRIRLEAVIAEQETTGDELVASNEELHSLNQELESSKEELEAANEELTTINEELQVRNAELETAREFAQGTIDTIRSSLVVLGPDLRILRANQSFFRTFRLAPGDVEQRLIYDLPGGDWNSHQFKVLLEQTLEHRQNLQDVELVQDLPSGRRRILVLNARHFEREDRILLAIEDVTVSRRNEDELRQSQKIEAIGHLAAGVAHDFNNLLTGILCNASFALHLLPDAAPARTAVEGAVAGANRAAELTRQLLACAGKSRFYLTLVNLSELVIDTANRIRASIPASVQLQLDLDKYLPLVLADPSQVQQIVANLVINGVEAVGNNGGSILVRTGRQTVSADVSPDLYLDEKPAPGEYLFLEVRDNGSGMDSQTVQRIFDPFFTTKFTGRGLGLAAVLGIVRQQKGAIQIYSVLGKGSAFKVLFLARVDASSEASELEEDLRGGGTVLVVDDEETIRDCARSALQSYGYSVLAAEDGLESIRIFQDRFRDINLVLLDAAMPKLDGPAILQRIREISPDVPVLVSGGFGDSDIESRYYGLAFSEFFPKPYTVRQLAGKVKQWVRPRQPAMLDSLKSKPGQAVR